MLLCNTTPAGGRNKSRSDEHEHWDNNLQHSLPLSYYPNIFLTQNIYLHVQPGLLLQNRFSNNLKDLIKLCYRGQMSLLILSEFKQIN